jgi:hypothetical protein
MLKNNKKQITFCLIFVKQKIICFLANLNAFFHLPCGLWLVACGLWHIFLQLFLSNKILSFKKCLSKNFLYILQKNTKILFSLIFQYNAH